MQISDEVVEVAAKQVWRGSAAGRRTCEAWEGLGGSEQRPCIDAARTILEAAAPYIAAEAWDEGQRAWEDELLGRVSGTNPHRSRA